MSFDDGWRGNILLHDILKKYNIQVTVFLTTQAIERGIFRDSLESRFKDKLPDEYQDNPKKLKDIPNKLRSEIDNSLLEFISGFSYREALNIQEIKDLSKSSEFCFQAHTHTHPICLKWRLII